MTALRRPALPPVNPWSLWVTATIGSFYEYPCPTVRVWRSAAREAPDA